MSDAPWLLLLFTLPAGSGTARVNVWRKLKKTGALPFRTSAYLLPNRPDLAERFQWMVQQVKDAGGEATLAFVTELEGVSHEEMVRQFNETRATDYGPLTQALNDLIARRRSEDAEAVPVELEKLRRRYEEVRQLDFFGCPAAQEVAALLERAAASTGKTKVKSRERLHAGNFAGKTWLTRPRPAIDRVGSAWLITRHIDANARFVFANDPAIHPEAIPFDMAGVEFTHHGDDCTFETLLRRFVIKDRALVRMGEMIHDADLDDGKFQTVEAFGLDRVFKGWAALGLPDDEILARGLPCFDALYQYLKIQR